MYFLDTSGLNTYDLSTRKAQPVLANVVLFAAGDTHLLVVGVSETMTYPVYLLELATSALVRLGDFDPMIDAVGIGNTLQTSSWTFDPHHARVLHLPIAATATGEVFDFAGKRTPLPLTGRLYDTLSDGTVLTQDSPLSHMFAARPGDAAAVQLDLPLASPDPTTERPVLRVHAGRLEASFAGALHEAALAGGPPRVLVEGVGASWTWLDDDHLVTVFDEALTSITTKTGARTIHHAHAMTLRPAADNLGVYYLIAGPDGDPDNGVWYLPATAL